jgi:hypothetical protein
MPPNYIEPLALELGDYDATTGRSLNEDPLYSGMVMISPMRQVPDLEQMKLQGFSSENLEV